MTMTSGSEPTAAVLRKFYGYGMDRQEERRKNGNGHFELERILLMRLNESSSLVWSGMTDRVGVK